MPDDRTLLEMAAKAAGIDRYYYDGGIFGVGMIDDEPDGGVWNPLTSDADAFRLAVELGLVLNLSPRKDCREQTVVTYNGMCKIEEPCYDGRDVAARRAIVRAAAALGEGK